MSRLYMLSDDGILHGRGRHGMWKQRARRKRLELMAEFKKASDTRSFKKRVTIERLALMTWDRCAY
jgi:hypothetical protein